MNAKEDISSLKNNIKANTAVRGEYYQNMHWNSGKLFTYSKYHDFLKIHFINLKMPVRIIF